MRKNEKRQLIKGAVANSRKRKDRDPADKKLKKQSSAEDLDPAAEKLQKLSLAKVVEAISKNKAVYNDSLNDDWKVNIYTKLFVLYLLKNVSI